MKKYMIYSLVGCFIIMSLVGCSTNNSNKPTSNTTETTKEVSKDNKKQAKEVVLKFGEAILNNNFESAVNQTNIEKNEFFNVDDFENYLKNTNYLKGFFDTEINIETFKQNLENATITKVENNLTSIIIQGDIVIYLDSDMKINCEEFAINTFLIACDKDSKITLDNIDLLNYKLKDEKQILDNKIVYSIPSFNFNKKRIVNINEMKKEINTISFEDNTIMYIDNDGNISYMNLDVPNESVKEKDMLAFLTIQNSSYDYKTEFVSNVTKNDDGTISVKNTDGNTDILDKNGKFIKKVSPNESEIKSEISNE